MVYSAELFGPRLRPELDQLYYTNVPDLFKPRSIVHRRRKTLESPGTGQFSAEDCCGSPATIAGGGFEVFFDMDMEAAKTARESLELAFQMSNILETGLDRHTLSVLIALCDLGVNPEALAAVVRELRRERSASAATDQKQL
ncbi:hypothetical protein MLD38_025973 [Melastoma candidum]|uniref:Uncharacterized protein n=1 Tax=Melastoma candidum TaxID=119954 RepID=A0ACB9NYG8_9MYRT|nr:hypothetical protein MLD38_025973 [Melastoma candidum]